jgi:hypothetical protein
MEGYTTDNMFQSQGYSIEESKQNNEINIEQNVQEQNVQEQHVQEQHVQEQHVPEQHDQEQEHPLNENMFDNQSNLINQENDKPTENASYLMSMLKDLCNFDNVILIVLFVLIAILYKLYY